MEWLAFVLLILGIPSMVYAVVAAVVGFFHRALQVGMLAAGIVGVFLLCRISASDDSGALLLILPLAVIPGLATVFSLLLTSLMEQGYREEVALQKDDRAA